MNDLLKFAINAHGGMERWNTLSRITADVSIGGGLWPAKGKGGILDRLQVQVDCHRQHVEYWPFRADGQRSVFEPDRVSILGADGRVVESRDHPRASFDGHARDTQWTDLDLVYFSGYAMWTYLTTPFSSAMTTLLTCWAACHQLTWRRTPSYLPALLFPRTVAYTRDSATVIPPPGGLPYRSIFMIFGSNSLT